VVGGGAAGETYAYASDILNAGLDILLIERGHDETNNPDLALTNVNRLFPAKVGLHNPYVNIYTREPVRNDVLLETANAIGGGYAVAASVYQKPSEPELAYWSHYFDLNGVWNYAKIQDALKFLENFSDTQGTGVNATFEGRGTSGILEIFKMSPSHPNLLPLNAQFPNYFNATFLTDINGVPNKDVCGFGAFDRALGHDPVNAIRQTIYLNYLKQRAAEPNSHVTLALDSHVVKVLFNNGNKCDRKNKDLKATGVRYIQDGIEVEGTLKDGGRVVLAAGAAVSSTILELSGIGNCTLLTSLGIPCLVENDGVGENLRDQGYFSNAYLAPGRADIDTGIMAAFFRSPTKPGPSNVADTEIAYSFIQTGAGLPILFSISVNLEQLNTGNVHIVSANPLYPAQMAYNWDVDGLEGDHYAFLFNQTRNFLETVASPLLPAPVPQSKSSVPSGLDEPTLLSQIFNLIESEFHPAGTARMGLVSDPMAVCDEVDARVFGTKNLYVVDSAFHPFPKRGHPNALIRAISYTLANIHHAEDD